MILKGFKAKSTKNYLNVILKDNQRVINSKLIKRVAVIVDLDAVSDYNIYSNFANLHNNFELTFITFTRQKQTETIANCFSPKDFNWKGVPKNEHLQQLLKTPFDALISYYTANDLVLKLLTASSKAQFKIGLIDVEQLNDLTIHTSLNNFDAFKTELLKYLNILNKI